MYDNIYYILDENGRVKTGIYLDGPHMGKKCILKSEAAIREANNSEVGESGVQLIL